jgi:hypothetical protein
MSILTLNKRCGKLKGWSFKMPNFSYCQPLPARCRESPDFENILKQTHFMSHLFTIFGTNKF